MSRVFDGDVPEMLWMQLDSDAGTQIVANSPPENLAFLGWDVTAAAYWLQQDSSSVYVVGGGGGRDILTADYFGATHIDVAELNRDVVAAVEIAFAEFSGSETSNAQFIA